MITDLKKLNHDALLTEFLDAERIKLLVQRIFDKDFLLSHHYKWNLEIEYPVIYNGYTKGFVDLLISLKFECIEKDCKWGYDSSANHLPKLIVELKMNSKNMGQTIRQINLDMLNFESSVKNNFCNPLRIRVQYLSFIAGIYILDYTNT